MNKIWKLVKEKSTLPNGNYYGLASGFTIDVIHKDDKYQIDTDTGVKGMNVPCNVSVKDGVVTVDYKHY